MGNNSRSLWTFVLLVLFALGGGRSSHGAPRKERPGTNASKAAERPSLSSNKHHASKASHAVPSGALWLDSKQIWHVFRENVGRWLGAADGRWFHPQTHVLHVRRGTSYLKYTAVGSLRAFPLFGIRAGQRLRLKQEKHTLPCGRGKRFPYHLLKLNGKAYAAVPQYSDKSCFSVGFSRMVQRHPALQGLLLQGLKCKAGDLGALRKLTALRWMVGDYTSALAQRATYTLLAKLPKLRALWLHSTDVPVEGLAQLHRLKRLALHHVTLRRQKPSHRAFGPRWRHLQHLTLYATTPTATDLKAMARCPALHTLTIARIDYTKHTLRSLRLLRTLRTLRLHFIHNTPKRWLQDLPTQSPLRALSLRGCRLPQAQLPLLHAFLALRKLDLRDIRLSDSTLKLLLSPPARRHLRQLAIGATALHQDGLKPLGRLRALRTLHLQSFVLKHKGLKHLLPLTNSLHTLRFASNSIDDQAMTRLARFTQLRTLAIPYTQVTDKGVLALRSLSSLRSLSIGSNKLQGRTLATLGQLRHLRKLSLVGAKIQVKGMRWLQQLPHLRALRLSWLTLSTASIRTLRKVRALRTLELPGTKLPRTLLQGLSGHPRLRELDLSYTSFRNKHLPFLCKLPALRVLQARQLSLYDPTVRKWARKCGFFFHKIVYNFGR